MNQTTLDFQFLPYCADFLPDGTVRLLNRHYKVIGYPFRKGFYQDHAPFRGLDLKSPITFEQALALAPDPSRVDEGRVYLYCGHELPRGAAYRKRIEALNDLLK